MLSRTFLRAPVARIASRALTLSAARNQEPEVPRPPPSVDDSTSAFDYKSSQRTRPPPLPVFDVPRERSAEEAVSNILYNTPPPSLQPFKQYVHIRPLQCIYAILESC